MSNFADVLQANLWDHKDKVASATIQFSMMAYKEVLKNAYVPLQELKQYKKDLAQFKSDKREEFESMWVLKMMNVIFSIPHRGVGQMKHGAPSARNNMSIWLQP
jgi:hypothetical protein